jgi:hypothetical protein
MHEPPAIRAHYSRLALKRLRAYPEGKGAEIRDRVATRHLAAIREAASMSWLAVEAVCELCDAILDVLGEPAANGFWTDLMRDSYDSGLLKPLTVLAHFSLGKSGAARLLHTAPRAWALSTRNCGTLEVVDDKAEHRLRLRGVDLIPEILASRGFVCVFHGACQAMLELFKSRGRIRVYQHDVGDRPQIAFEIAFDA